MNVLVFSILPHIMPKLCQKRRTDKVTQKRDAIAAEWRDDMTQTTGERSLSVGAI